MSKKRFSLVLLVITNNCKISHTIATGKYKLEFFHSTLTSEVQALLFPKRILEWEFFNNQEDILFGGNLLFFWKSWNVPFQMAIYLKLTVWLNTKVVSNTVLYWFIVLLGFVMIMSGFCRHFVDIRVLHCNNLLLSRLYQLDYGKVFVKIYISFQREYSFKSYLSKNSWKIKLFRKLSKLCPYFGLRSLYLLIL